MERKGFAEKLRNWKAGGRGLGGLAVILGVGVIFLTLGLRMSPRFASRSSQGQGSVFGRIWGAYADAFRDLQAEVEALRRADEENQKLRAENAHLRLVLESGRYECYSQRAAKLTRDFEMKLSRETGSRTGRTLASIPYKVPMDLMPSQLYSLGISYFHSREDEKAAVILTFLTGLEDEKSFKTPRDFLLTGIAWYRLQNFELADFYFDKVLKTQDEPENAKIHSQVRLWKALVAHRLGKKMKAQYWMREVLDRNPHSIEAAWVNSGTHTRKIASTAENEGEGSDEAELKSASVSSSARSDSPADGDKKEVEREPADAD